MLSRLPLLPSALLFVSCLLLSGCLQVSHPFADPGAEARRLTQQNMPPARLAVPVPVPTDASWRPAAALWARDVVVALLGQSVPAMSQRPRSGDWWVRLGVVSDPGGIKPHYALVDPQGKVRARGYGAVIDRPGWLAADPDALNTVALQIAPEIARMLTGIQAQMMQADPQSLMNRSARVCFEGVHGGPGDGDIALGRAFWLAFPDTRNSVQETKKDADYTVRAEVHVKNLSRPSGSSVSEASGGATQQVLIVWRVTTADGKEAGAATQLHDIPAHSLDGAWGDVASVAAQEAAGAVRTIVTNYSGREHKPLSSSVKASVAEQDDDRATHYVDGPAVHDAPQGQIPKKR